MFGETRLPPPTVIAPPFETLYCVLTYFVRLQVRGRRRVGVQMQPVTVDKNPARSVPGPAEFRRRNANILLFRLGNKQIGPQTLHVADPDRHHGQVFLLFKNDESRLGAVNRDHERNDVRLGSRGHGIVFQNDLAAQHSSHHSGTNRSVRLYR